LLNTLTILALVSPVRGICRLHEPAPSNTSADTTRSPRPGEQHGQHYFFVTAQKFKELIQDSAFIEHAEYAGNFYGTSFDTVRQIQHAGRRCILEIEAQVRVNSPAVGYRANKQSIQ
jgi:guanylate kinase